MTDDIAINPGDEDDRFIVLLGRTDELHLELRNRTEAQKLAEWLEEQQP